MMDSEIKILYYGTNLNRQKLHKPEVKDLNGRTLLVYRAVLGANTRSEGVRRV